MDAVVPVERYRGRTEIAPRSASSPRVPPRLGVAPEPPRQRGDPAEAAVAQSSSIDASECRRPLSTMKTSFDRRVSVA